MAARPDMGREACRQRLGDVARLSRAGLSAQQVGWRLGISPRTVDAYRARARAGWEPYARVRLPRRHAAAFVAEAVARYASGESTRTVAAALGVSRAAVQSALKQAGVAPRTVSEANAARWRRRPGPRRDARGRAR